MSYTFIVKFEINAVPEGKVLLGSVSDNAMGLWEMESDNSVMEATRDVLLPVGVVMAQQGS